MSISNCRQVLNIVSVEWEALQTASAKEAFLRVNLASKGLKAFQDGEGVQPQQLASA